MTLTDSTLRWAFDDAEDALRRAVSGVALQLPARFSFDYKGQRYRGEVHASGGHSLLRLTATLPPMPFSAESRSARSAQLGQMGRLAASKAIRPTLTPGARPQLSWLIRLPHPCDMGTLCTIATVCVLGARSVHAAAA
jgi:hypothetical protein